MIKFKTRESKSQKAKLKQIRVMKGTKNGDRQKKEEEESGYSHKYTQSTHINTHTYTLARTTLTSHYLKEIFYSTLVSMSHHVSWEQLQFPIKCFFLHFILGDVTVTWKGIRREIALDFSICFYSYNFTNLELLFFNTIYFSLCC